MDRSKGVRVTMWPVSSYKEAPENDSSEESRLRLSQVLRMDRKMLLS